MQTACAVNFGSNKVFRDAHRKIKSTYTNLHEKRIKSYALEGVFIKMTDLDLRKKASEIATRFRDNTISDEEIILQIKEIPELVHTKCLSDSNLFLSAVLANRFFGGNGTQRYGG